MELSTLHPLKKAAIKPSSSTLRGMLSAKEFKIVDAALQSLRSAGGLELEWVWRGRDTGWVCTGKYSGCVICEVHAADEPIRGVLPLSSALVTRLMGAKNFPRGFKVLLENPIEEAKNVKIYELEIETTEFRDLLTELVSEILNHIE